MRSFRGSSWRWRSSSWRWLTSLVVGVAVVAGGAGYAAAHALNGGLTSGLASSLIGSTAEQTTAGQTTAAPTASPVAAAAAPKPGQAGGQTPGQPQGPAPVQANNQRIMGEVVGITPDPATFTILTTAGAQATFRVLDTTVFAAGPDRPYNFGLLKTGDQVNVRGGAGAGAGAGGGAGKVQAEPSPVADAPAAKPAVKPNARAGGKAKPGQGNAGQTTRAARPADGTLVARQVMVRPAGESRKGNQGQAAAKPNGAANVENGGTNAAGQ